MHKTKIVTLVLLIVIFTGVSTASANELKKEGFSISLPSGWVEVPIDVIEAFVKKIARFTPDAQANHCEYGFQLKSSKRWFEYPYILVQINNNGRIPKSQLAKYERYNIKKYNILDNKFKKSLSPIISDMQIGKIVYDKQNKILWVHMESNVVNIGRIAEIFGMVLTEKGYIQVMCYCLRKNYSTYKAIFQSVVLSISIEPGLDQKPKVTGQLASLPPSVTGIDWGKVAGKAIAGAIIGGIIALIAALRKKKNG